MKGYCHLTQIPVRAEAKSSAEMTTQLIYGETYTVLQQENDWYYIRSDNDNYEGWLSDSSFKSYDDLERNNIQQELFAVHPIGNSIVITSMGSQLFGAILDYDEEKSNDLKEIATRFLGVPYLWGGRTFTGIDCSGLVQIVFKCIGVSLDRDASQQQKQGKAIRFDEIIEGDVIFFESNFKVTHVGIALSGGKIIHAHGEVRVDQLTKKGIYNADLDKLTHKFHSARRMR